MTSVGTQKLKGNIKALFKASGDDFVSLPTDILELQYEGIKGDYHAGLTRLSGGREPWYERGTEMRNERQISMLSVQEMATVAAKLSLDEIDVGRIGGNFLVDGIADFSKVPPRSQMFFPSGAVVRIDGYNAPCKIAGKSLQDVHDNRDDIEFGFVGAAQNIRGLVGWVERPGAVHVGDEFTLRVWPQELYMPAG